MKKLFALAGLAAILAACSSTAPVTAEDSAALVGPGAAVAADLGYHGPIERMYSRNGN